ncbi:MAG TPA: carbamoyltransferase C-terminal domain-containing protein [Burkholderiales bacterium]|nr:carbamoyltransferase C-terminal domain-containing protein [Burkholderiales bacterium]
MFTLGINAAFHDSSACLVHDGRVIAAAEEERFTRIKHAKRPVPFSAWELPFHAIHYCLQEADLDLADVDHVAYSLDPALLPARLVRDGSIELPLEPSAAPPDDALASPWDPLFLCYVVNAPRQLASGAPHHLARRFRGVRHDGPFRWHFVEHHRAHEASAFLAAPFERCAVLTLDGRGERATTSFGVFRDGVFRRLKQVDFPHSLGLLYEDVTRYLGFLHSSDEYKVMALASFGEPRYVEDFREMIQLDGQGGFVRRPVDLVERFGPARERGEALGRREWDIAASLQALLEQTELELAAWLREASGERDLAMAGGVALNCVANSRLRDSGLFDNVWVQPAAGDAGTALGAALVVDFEARGTRRWKMEHAYYGPGYADQEIESLLRSTGAPYRRSAHIALDAADLLAAGKVVGWFQGRMEFGPRALGARSILASPIDPGTQARLNALKDREDFRPVAPVVLQEALADWFMPAHANGGSSPFMLFVYGVRPEKADRIPAVRHVDGTARVQTVTRAQNPRYYETIRAFGEKTGVPVLVNTSFNTRSEPIVCTPRDALASFWTAPLDALAIGQFLVEKRA